MPDDLRRPEPVDGLRLDALPRTDTLVFISNNDPWTLARLAWEVDRFAAGLVAFGIRPGERVALHLRNGREIAIGYLACFRIGAVAAPLNLRFKQPELEDVLRRLQPRLYLGQHDLYHAVAGIDEAVLPGAARFLVDTAHEPTARSWAELRGARHVLPAPGSTDPNAPAVLLLTSGTTGRPKFVAHSLAALSELASRGRYLGMAAGQRNVGCSPMVHMSGMFAFLAGLKLGMQFVMCDNADPGVILDTIEQYGCDVLGTLPTTASALVEAQRKQRRDVSSLRLVLSAGDAPQPGLQAAWEEVFGCPLRSFWASTEAAGSFTYGATHGPVSRLTPGTEMRLLNGDGTEVGPGEPGEMWLRGPHVTLGYWQLPGTLSGLQDGYCNSGDLMRRDADGSVRFVGRLKDLIVRGGSNISPVEVEAVIASHPAVADAGVAGVPDPMLGQRVMAMVRLHGGTDPGVLSDIVAAMSAQLADYKLPERLFLTRVLPRNGAGKMDRNQLSLMLQEHLDAHLADEAMQRLPTASRAEWEKIR